MLVDVTMLRRKGMRLREPELSAPVRGHLVVTDNDGRGMSMRRPYREAVLVDYVGTTNAPRGLLGPPLLDAVVLRIEGDTITVQGTEPDSETVDGQKRVREFVLTCPRCAVQG